MPSLNLFIVILLLCMLLSNCTIQSSVYNKYIDSWMSTECGTWMQNYTSFHMSMLNGHIPARYVISLAGKSGLSDNLTGMMTQFLFALLSNRAFLRLSYGRLPHFESVYEAPNINWTSFSIPDYTYQCMKPPYVYFKNKSTSKCTFQKMHLVTWKGLRFYPLDMINTEHDTMFIRSDLRFYPAVYDAEVILFSGHRGRVWATFNNYYHKQDLARMGLKPSTAFSCLFHYLFRLRTDICDVKCQKLKTALQIAKTNNVFSIGIHIRLRDNVFVNETEVTLSSALGHFKCAEELVASLPKKRQHKWLFYLTTNSLKLRRLAKEKYGDRLLTDLTNKPLHTDCTKNHDCASKTVSNAINHAAVDLMLLSMTDAHVISMRSGFGVVGAMLSSSANHSIFRVERYAPRVEVCRLGAPDDLARVTEEWSGV